MIAGVIGNMITPIELIQRVLDGMMARRFGRIVNITSSSVKAPISGLDLSSGARAGLTAFLKGVGHGAAGSNVTINNLLPGSFDTDRLRPGMTREAERRGVDVSVVRAEREAKIPAKRLGTPEEFGQACAFLCSAQAGYITGQNLLIDGGAYMGVF
jgi:3-oxoacyl-[acyl-carrier protein] reductase